MTAETTQDAFFDGALTLRQPAKGHRIGSDAVLLAAACPPGALRICEFGSGVGAVGLRLAQTNPAASVDLVEIDPASHALATENIAVNALEGRVNAWCADILSSEFGKGDQDPAPGSCNILVTNPPFFDVGQGRPSPDPGKRRAHSMISPLEAWIRSARGRLKPKGQLLLIHRADALARLLAAISGQFGDIRLRFVQPRAEMPAHRVLLKARLGSRAPLIVLPPVVLHETSGTFTPLAEALHRGSAVLTWDEAGSTKGGRPAQP